MEEYIAVINSTGSDMAEAPVSRTVISLSKLTHHISYPRKYL